MRFATLLLLATLGTTACHTMSFQLADQPRGPVVTQRKWYFFGGLAPTRVIDVQEKCPNGATAVMEQTTFVDGLVDLVTLDLCTPRSTTYYCRQSASAEAGK